MIILGLLEADARLSTYQITKKTAIPQTTVLNRIRKLQESGIIKRFSIEVDWKKLGRKSKVLIFVKVDKRAERQTSGNIGEIEKKIAKFSLVQSVKRLMGDYDFVIEMMSSDIDEFNDFLITKIRSLESVADTKSMIVLAEWENTVKIGNIYKSKAE